MIPELTKEQEDFRSRLCELLCEEPVRLEIARSRRMPLGQEAGLLDAYRRLGGRGWLAVNWPARYGGGDATIVEKAIVTEELIAHGIPDVLHVLGIDIVGLAIHLFGTAEQKRRLLPGLARGETTANVLFSEPGVGSDLASLTTSATPDGDGWRLSGRKIFNMKGQFCDFALCAARTSASPVPYFGITLFLVPLNSVGVIMRPMWNLSEERFDEVVLDGIRVGPADVLGEVDNGWQVLNQVLPLERTGIDYAAKAARTLDALLRYLSGTGGAADPEYRARLVGAHARVRAARLLAWRCVHNLARGEPDEVQSATAKWYTSEVAKEVAGLAVELIGLPAVLDARDDSAVADGLFDATYREAPGFTLAAGTSEVMLYFVATSGLGLTS